MKPRDFLGDWGPFKAVDVVLPVAASFYFRVPLLYTVLGQTLVHYQLGIETVVTSLVLPRALFKR